MSTTQKPEALRIADAAANAGDAGYPTAKKANAYYLCLLDDCAQMIRKLHAENTTLQAGDAAARLEIESLQRRVQEVGAVARREHERADRAMRAAQPAGAQQPGADYAALFDALSQHDDSCDDFAEAAQRVRALRAEVERLTRAESARIDALALRASHGQAPAQAAPAAVAGPVVRRIERTYFPNSPAHRALSAFCHAMHDRNIDGADMRAAMLWFLGLEESEEQAAAAPTTQPAPQQEPFGWVKSSEIESARKLGGSINLWRKRYDCDTPLYTDPKPSPASQGDALDAARYRWLRINAIGAFRTNEGKGPVSVYHLSKIPAIPGIPEETDAAIDAAMNKGGAA